MLLGRAGQIYSLSIAYTILIMLREVYREKYDKKIHSYGYGGCFHY